jgi:hypothetical protein
MIPVNSATVRTKILAGYVSILIYERRALLNRVFEWWSAIRLQLGSIISRQAALPIVKLEGSHIDEAMHLGGSRYGAGTYH